MAIIVVVVGDNKVESGDLAGVIPCPNITAKDMCVGRPTKHYLGGQFIYKDVLHLEEDLLAYVVCPGLNLNWWLRINPK